MYNNKSKQCYRAQNGDNKPQNLRCYENKNSADDMTLPVRSRRLFTGLSIDSSLNGCLTAALRSVIFSICCSVTCLADVCCFCAELVCPAADAAAAVSQSQYSQ